MARAQERQVPAQGGAACPQIDGIAGHVAWRTVCPAAALTLGGKGFGAGGDGHLRRGRNRISCRGRAVYSLRHNPVRCELSVLIATIVIRNGVET